MNHPPHAIRSRCKLWMILLLLLTSCDEVKRHDVLTFFFDGVPPLPSKTRRMEPSAGKDQESDAVSALGNWHVHEPLKDCTQCHGSQPRRASSSGVHLVAEVPQLCYQCHSQYSHLQGWVHGPVAAGDCLLCHEQHKSRNEALLAKPIPDLCYQCHEAQAIRMIDQHAQESYAHCTDCHEAHASATKALLRPVTVPTPQGTSDQSMQTSSESSPSATADPSAGTIDPTKESVPPSPGIRGPNQEQGEDALAAKTPQEDARAVRKREVAELYYRSIKQYHAGQLREAREGLLETLQSGLLPPPMQETVRLYLGNIDEALRESPETGRRSQE